MTRTILVAGTASHVGKSTIVAGLCRLLSDEGVAVAPFKAQNMSNNAQVALTPDGAWGELGTSQYVQARAARIAPTTDVNPVLLKPRGAGESQLIVHGQAVGNVSAGRYDRDQWEGAVAAVNESFSRLAAEYDVIIAEGAGSIAEINLSDRDLANRVTATMADAAILLVADIDRGGAFASIYGTLALLPGHVRDRVVGVLINKFRGEVGLLAPGITEIEERTGVPVIGVLPFADPGLPAEDSVSIPGSADGAVLGDDDGIPASERVTIAVPRLPRIANFTDLDPLARVPGVHVHFVGLEADLNRFDAVVIPGSKNSVDDLLAIKDAGFDRALRAFDGPVIGICGGYQLLGARITRADIEGSGDHSIVEGLGLLPVETRFSRDKHVARVTHVVDGRGPLDGATGEVTGYEIHMGRTDHTTEAHRPLGEASCVTGQILGTYLHGLFENGPVRTAFVETIFATAGLESPDVRGSKHASYDTAAKLVEEHVDLAEVGLPSLSGPPRRTAEDGGDDAPYSCD